MLSRQYANCNQFMKGKYCKDTSFKKCGFIQPLALIVFFIFINSKAQSQDTSQYFPQLQCRGGGNIYRLFSESSDSKNVELNGTNYDLQYLCKYAAYDVGITFGRQDVRFSNINKKNGLEVALHGAFDYAKMDFHCLPGIFNFGLSMEMMRMDSLHFFDYSSAIGIRLQRSELPTYEVKVVSRHLPFFGETKYDSIDALLVTPINLIHVEHRLRYTGSRIMTSVAYSKIFPQSDDNDFTYTQKNQSNVAAWIVDAEYTATDYKLSANYRNLDLRSSIDLLSRGLEYGNFNITGIHYYSCGAKYEKNYSNNCNLILTGDYYHISGKLVGHVESWPFATVIQSLFANREYLRMSGSAALEALSVTGSIPLSYLRIAPTLTFCRIVPDFSFETWRPEFLVFGMSDYSRSEMNFKEMGAGLIKVQVNYEGRLFLLKLEGTQLFPVYSISKSERSEKQPISNAGTTSVARHVVDGGRWFEFNIGIKF